MPVHVENVTTEVTFSEEEIGLSEDQVDKLTAVILSRLEEQRRAEADRAAATELRSRATPPSPITE